MIYYICSFGREDNIAYWCGNKSWNEDIKDAVRFGNETDALQSAYNFYGMDYTHRYFFVMKLHHTNTKFKETTNGETR